MLIAVSGKIGSGKDTVAEMLSYIHFCKNEDREKYINYDDFLRFTSQKSLIGTVTKYRIYKFADSLKQCLAVCLGITRPELESRTVKALEIDWLGGLSVRELLQKFATGIRNEVNEDFWVNTLLHKYKSTYTWFISDLRYLNEARACKSLGGILIRVNRPAIHENEHVSETQLDSFPYFDYIINNNKGLEELFNECKKIILDIKK